MLNRTPIGCKKVRPIKNSSYLTKKATKAVISANVKIQTTI